MTIERAGPRLVEEPPVGTPVVTAPPDTCPYCGGSGSVVMGDEVYPCWCEGMDEPDWEDLSGPDNTAAGHEHWDLR